MRIGIIEAREGVRAEIIALAQSGLGVDVRPIMMPADIHRPYPGDGTRGPDVLLLGLDSQPAAALTAGRMVREWNPSCNIVMYGAAIVPQYFNQAMALGAKLCLGYPFDSSALAGALATATPRTGIAALPPVQAQPQFAAMPTARPILEPSVLTVFSPKGGVGTSVLAVNIAVALSEMGHKVALVDGNASFGTIGLLLFPEFDRVPRTMIDLVEESADLPSYERIAPLMHKHDSGVEVLLSPLKPVQAAQITPELLSHIVTTLRGEFEFVVVDTQTSYEDRELQLLDVADKIIVPIAPEVTALHSLHTFFDTALNLLDYSRDKLLPVLVRANTVPSQHITQAEQVLGQPLVWRVVSDGPLVQDSVNRGRPFVTVHPQAEVSRNVRALAAHLANQELPELQEVSRGARWSMLSPLLSRMQEALSARS